MANNVKSGLNFIVGKINATWADIGLATVNTLEIYTTINGTPVSWRPDKLINTLTTGGIVLGQGYLLNSKADRDLTAFFIPPVTSTETPLLTLS